MGKMSLSILDSDLLYRGALKAGLTRGFSPTRYIVRSYHTVGSMQGWIYVLANIGHGLGGPFYAQKPKAWSLKLKKYIYSNQINNL